MAVIGTGSSGIQAIPVIAAQASELTVFQRTPNFSIPARNGPLPAEDQQAFKASTPSTARRAKQTRSGILYDYSQRATHEASIEEREAEYERRWRRGGANFTHAFNDLFIDRAANDQAAEFVRNKIRSTVKDPEVAELLAPKDHADRHQAHLRRHRLLRDLQPPQCRAWSTCAASRSRRSSPAGIRTARATYELDAIVFATGFDAITGALDRIDIRGRGGRVAEGQVGRRARAPISAS